MKKRKQLSLQKIGNDQVMVEVAGHRVNQARVYTLNETAAWIWENVERHRGDIGALAQEMSRVYDVSPPKAQEGIARQIEQWSQWGLVTTD